MMPVRPLDSRLNAHFATLRSPSAGETLKYSAGNWKAYAAVTGSALAMATNASAGVIYQAGPVTVGPVANVAATVGQSSLRETSFKKIELKTALGANLGIGLSFGLTQRQVGANFNGYAALKSVSNGGFLFTVVHDKVAKLSSGVKISAHSPVASPIWEGGKVNVATQSKTAGSAGGHSGWAANQYGFAAFEFSTAGHQQDFGWVRLEYGVGSNGLANGVTVKDWAYATGGAPINTGQGVPSVPEPASGGLALLAAGAAGIAALRRRRESAA